MKLANFVVNAESIQEIRDFCGVANDSGFTPQEVAETLELLQRYHCLALALSVSRAPPSTHNYLPLPPSLSTISSRNLEPT